MSESPTKDVHISNATIRRLLYDVKTIMKNPIHDQGIYYKHDESDILKGYAMIIGPIDTVYAHGFYFFEITYPSNYPHSPPIFKFYTNDGYVRFNPNLYKNGKVCLSVLNTWRGEGWTSCQTISSVLITVCSILCNKPLLNEPGITPLHRDMKPYDDIIKYKSIHLGVYGMLHNKSRYFSPKFEHFKSTMKDYFIKHYSEILEIVNKNKKEYSQPVTLSTGVYNMYVEINYKRLKQNLKDLYRSLTETSKSNELCNSKNVKINCTDNI